MYLNISSGFLPLLLSLVELSELFLHRLQQSSHLLLKGNDRFRHVVGMLLIFALTDEFAVILSTFTL